MFSSRKKFKGTEIDNPLDEMSFNRETPEITAGETKPWQLSFLWWIILSILLILFGRTFYLQIVKGNYYKQIAENNRIRKTIIRAPRGIIKDRKGEVLAGNIPSFELTFTPAYLPTDDKSLMSLVNQITKFVNISPKQLLDKLKKYPRTDQRTHSLVENINDEEALRLKEQSGILQGVNIAATARRQYTDGNIFSHPIGYDGKVSESDLKKHPNYLLIDYIGKDGLEESYEKYLHGQHGEHRYEVNARGEVIRNLGTINPIAGYELTLNIDADLQRKIYREAEKIMAENEDATGVIVVALDPRNGAVRALVSYPGYDNNLFAKGIDNNMYSQLLNDPHKPLINKALAGLYPPGSTFKTLVAAAALEENIVRPETTVNCHGNISIGAWNFPDWKAHGITDLRKAIAESCDVYFYTVGGGWQNIRGLGIEQIKKYSKFFGLGDYLGIDLPGEKKGLVPDATWKFKELGEKWYIGDTYHNAIGQGYLLTTPLQIANLAATIANGGTVYRPRVVKEMKNENKKDFLEISPDVLNEEFIKPENIKIVQEGMRQTVTSGSGRLLSDLKVHTAGKTGTAQFGNEDKTHSWYMSYAPYENPELAMVVLVESGGEGHSWAVPLTKAVYKWYFDDNRKEQTENNQEEKNKQ